MPVFFLQYIAWLGNGNVIVFIIGEIMPFFQITGIELEAMIVTKQHFRFNCTIYAGITMVIRPRQKALLNGDITL